MANDTLGSRLKSAIPVRIVQRQVTLLNCLKLPSDLNQQCAVKRQASGQSGSSADFFLHTVCGWTPTCSWHARDPYKKIQISESLAVQPIE
jgi:hypothetical protein